MPLHEKFYFLLSTQTYFNSEALNLIRVLITGGATPELEQILAEGVGFVKGTQSDREVFDTRNRCRVALLSLEEGLLQDLSVRLHGPLFYHEISLHYWVKL